jgi:hypothetical protein
VLVPPEILGFPHRLDHRLARIYELRDLASLEIGAFSGRLFFISTLSIVRRPLYIRLLLRAIRLGSGVLGGEARML